MFTGLVEAVGEVISLERSGEAIARLTIRKPPPITNVANGDSIAVNGCCLTVTTEREGAFTVELLEETIARTNLSALRASSLVNLERALPADGRLGGHFVQGHIDCAGRVRRFEKAGMDHRLEVEMPGEFLRYAVSKGSIALNGVSLTVAEISAESLAVWIIPHTFSATNLRTLGAGDLVNVEVDILAKYVERLLNSAGSR